MAQPPPLNRAALFDMLPIPELTQDILKKIPEDIQFQNIYDWARFRATATLVLFVKGYKTCSWKSTTHLHLPFLYRARHAVVCRLTAWPQAERVAEDH